MRIFLVGLFLTTGMNLALAQEPGADEPKIVPGKPLLAVEYGGHVAKVTDFNFSADGAKIVSASLDNTLQIWDAVTREREQTLRLPWKQHKSGLVGYVRDFSDHAGRTTLALSPDRKTLAVVLRIDGEKSVPMNFELFLLHRDTGQIKRLAGFENRNHLETMTFSPDGEALAAIGRGNTGTKFSGAKVWVWRDLLQAWDTDAPAVKLWKSWGAAETGHLALDDVQFSPTGDRLAVCGRRHQASRANLAHEVILVFDLKKPAAPPRTILERSHPQGLGNNANRLAWSPLGTRLAAIVKSQLPNEKKASKNKGKKTEKSDPTAKEGGPGRNELMVWTADGLLLRSVRYAPGSSTMRPVFRDENEVILIGAAAADAKTAAVLRFDLKKNQLDEVLPIQPPENSRLMKLAPDGKRVATFGGRAHDEITVLELEPKAVFQTLFTLPDTPYLAFSYQGHKLAWTGADRTKLVAGVDLHTAEALTPAQLQADRFATPTRTAASGIYEAGPRFPKGGLIDLRSRKQVFLRLYAAGQDWVVCTPEGYYAATPGGEKMVGWHVQQGYGKLAGFYPFERFRKKLYRPDVIALVLEKGSVSLALKVADALRGTETRDVTVGEELPPRAVLTVLDRSQLPSLKLKVQAEAASAKQPITALRLLLDGRPVPGKETLVEFPEGKQKAEVEWTFELPEGEHQLAVLARGLDSSGVSSPVRLKHVDQKKLPVLHVLTVGVNEYQDSSLNLKYAVPDASSLATAFAQYCPGPSFRDVKTHTLLDRQATAANVEQALLALRKEIQQQDLVVVFFACHGVKQQKAFYLLTHEADTNKLDQTALSGERLRSTLAEFKCQVFLMLDACHSAGFGAGKKLTQLGLKPATDDVTRTLTEDEIGVAVMCAAMSTEKAEGKDGHGLFTQAILEALAKKPGVPFSRRDQRLYVHHLYTYVFDEVRAQSEERQHPFLSLPWVVESFVIR